MDANRVVKQVKSLRVQFGGEEHRGWLPPGAAPPPPTPERPAILDVRIEDDGLGFLLICDSRNTQDSWDTWHETLEDAERQAQEILGIQASDWEAPSAS